MITDAMITQLAGLIMIGFGVSLLCWLIGWGIAKLWHMFTDIVRT